MSVIEADGLTFDVPDTFIVSKYDDWSFYRNKVNLIQEAKAIDLVILACDLSVAYFIEVKDFRVNPVTRARRTRTKLIELHREIAAKVLDSLGGIFAARLNASDVEEQQFAVETCKALSLRVILHLEQSSGGRLFPRPYDPATLQIKLRQTLKAVDPHVLVVSMQLPGKLPWKVT